MSDPLDDLAASLGIIPEMLEMLPRSEGAGESQFAIGAHPGIGWCYLIEIIGDRAVIRARWQALPGETILAMWKKMVYIVESGIGSMR